MDGKKVMVHDSHAATEATYAPYEEDHTMGGVTAQYCQKATRISGIPGIAA